MDSYKTILRHGKAEYEDRKSVFYADAAPVISEDEALAFIDSVKKRYPDARHHVYAYVLRNNSTMRFTDDREPQGTAGMPILDIIRKNGCTDTVIVVTRYFGGTLLGTGGLVRAYSSAALSALLDAQIITCAVYRELVISVSYSDYGKVSPLLEGAGFRVKDTVYSDNVDICGSIIANEADAVQGKVVELTSGRAKITVIGEKFDF